MEACSLASTQKAICGFWSEYARNQASSLHPKWPFSRYLALQITDLGAASCGRSSIGNVHSSPSYPC
jgi:hypothetical protein